MNAERETPEPILIGTELLTELLGHAPTVGEEAFLDLAPHDVRYDSARYRITRPYNDPDALGWWLHPDRITMYRSGERFSVYLEGKEVLWGMIPLDAPDPTITSGPDWIYATLRERGHVGYLEDVPARGSDPKPRMFSPE